MLVFIPERVVMERLRIQGGRRACISSGGQGVQADGGAWGKLKDGVMRKIRGHWKKTASDTNMTFDLIFKMILSQKLMVSKLISE